MKLIEEIDLKGTQDIVDMRPFHLFLEHKSLMVLRVQFLMEKSFLEKESSLLDQSLMLKDKYFTLQMKALKYNMKLELKELVGLKHTLLELLEEEKGFIEQLIAELVEKK